MVYKQDFRNLEYMEDENPVFVRKIGIVLKKILEYSSILR